ncbi:hypothetical protein [Frigidibacter mobilis]|uniref:Uncharacterized protein n=1 Tax=Frigidibacter mobilis TaxID=1335048 RepID=A0A159Z284_9RHOB|nr:hypothetical protein [Frigidibacter mobilis]AMY68130.1 hypothetical protein AKL17_0871 [Frigidibacter mobilis]
MTTELDQLRSRIAELRQALEAGIEERRANWSYRMERGRAVFEAGARQQHRELREGLAAYIGRARLSVVVTAPFIYALILPFALLDLFVTVYQAVCFPVYGIAKVRRADHIIIDRHMLAYLNGLQKLNCIYCGYCNGLISYVREIAGRTEAHWCPIKHARGAADPHAHYDEFCDFGDAEGFRAKVDSRDGRRRDG